MIILSQEIIALLPLLILCLTIFLILLFIFLCRNHIITFFITIFGINMSFISLYFVWRNGIQHVTNLICVDKFSILCMILVLIASLVSTMMSRMWLSYYYSGNCDEFYLLLLIITIGSIVVINASHVITLFFGIELISLPLFGLMSYVNTKKYSLEATIKYVVLSGVSTAFLLFGIALIYVETTHLSFMDISLELIRKDSLNQSMMLLSGIAMMLVGFGFKLSLVPFHLWTADVYQGVPEIAGICLATISKISIFSSLVRFFLLFSESYVKVIYLLIIISCASILFGNLMAIKQDNIKRILAYSSVSHMGYLLIGVIGSMNQFSISSDPCYVINLLSSGVEVISIYLINYLFTTLGVFSIFGLVYCFYCNSESDIGTISLYRGLFWKDPLLSIVFTILLLSLSGIPITLGFISKFYLIVLSVQRELWWCVIIIIFGTAIGILYYLRIITILYLGESLQNIRYLNISLKKLRKTGNNIKLVIFDRKKYYTKCMMTSSGIYLLISVFLLLFFGICPKYLTLLLSLIQT